MQKVILITGASSGIGRAAAALFLEKGWIVYAAARNLSRLQPLAEQGARIVTCDVCDAAQCRALVDRIVSETGRLDALVNNAGYGEYGPVETVADADAKRQMDVNVHAVARMASLVAPVMRKQGSGRIVNVTSAGGRATTYLGGWYHASKYAAESLTDALRMELRPFGVRVSAVEPGLVNTGWEKISAENLLKAGNGTVYEEACSSAAKVLSGAVHFGGLTQPLTVAKKIYHAANARHPRPRYLFGFGGRALVAGRALLPTAWYDAAMRRLYGAVPGKFLSES